MLKKINKFNIYIVSILKKCKARLIYRPLSIKLLLHCVNFFRTRHYRFLSYRAIRCRKMYYGLSIRARYKTYFQNYLIKFLYRFVDDVDSTIAKASIAYFQNINIIRTRRIQKLHLYKQRFKIRHLNNTLIKYSINFFKRQHIYKNLYFLVDQESFFINDNFLLFNKAKSLEFGFYFYEKFEDCCDYVFLFKTVFNKFLKFSNLIFFKSRCYYNDIYLQNNNCTVLQLTEQIINFFNEQLQHSYKKFLVMKSLTQLSIVAGELYINTINSDITDLTLDIFTEYFYFNKLLQVHIYNFCIEGYCEINLLNISRLHD